MTLRAAGVTWLRNWGTQLLVEGEIPLKPDPKYPLSPGSEACFGYSVLKLCFVFSVLVCAFIFVFYFKSKCEFTVLHNHLSLKYSKV